MLVFSRRVGEEIQIGDDVVISIVKIRGRDVQLGFSAPPGVAIHRAEVYERIHKTNAPAAASSLAASKAESA